jgi:hypothetical protein
MGSKSCVGLLSYRNSVWAMPLRFQSMVFFTCTHILFFLCCNAFTSGWQNTRSLIRDIAILELEVLHLEQHLLSLYRRAYEVKIKDESCVSKVLNKGDVLLRSQYGQPYLQESPLSTKKYTPQKKTSSPSSSSKSGSLVSRTLDKSIGNRSFNQPKLDRIQGVLNTADKPKSSFSYSQPIQVSTRMVQTIWSLYFSPIQNHFFAFLSYTAIDVLMGSFFCIRLNDF